MNKSQQRHIERLRRVAGFGSSHESEFTANSRARSLFKDLGNLVTELDTPKKRTRGRAPGSANSSEKQQAFSVLLGDLEAISRSARVIETFNPEISGKFLVPDKRRRNDLAAAAREFLAEGENFKADFLSLEMPRSFLKDLNTNLTAYENAKAKPAKVAGNPSGANAALKGSIGQAQEILNTLDVMMNNKYRNVPEAMAEWNSANALEFTPRKRRSKKDAA